MIRRPPRSTRTDTLFPYTTLFRSWRHRVEIEEVTSAIPATDYPRFVDGERRATPEDVGGTPGFEDFLKAMAKPRHPARESLIQWYGGVLDPADISSDEVNTRIAKLSSDASRVGNECVNTCTSSGMRYHKQKKRTTT